MGGEHGGTPSNRLVYLGSLEVGYIVHDDPTVLLVCNAQVESGKRTSFTSCLTGVKLSIILLPLPLDALGWKWGGCSPSHTKLYFCPGKSSGHLKSWVHMVWILAGSAWTNQHLGSVYSCLSDRSRSHDWHLLNSPAGKPASDQELISAHANDCKSCTVCSPRHGHRFYVWEISPFPSDWLKGHIQTLNK